MKKSIRLYFVDAVRAFAILMMLQGHFIDTLLDPIYRDNTSVIYNTWRYFRGITAPTFFTISGLIFTFLLLRAYQNKSDLIRIKKGFFRGILLIGTGYLLRINFQNWIYDGFNTHFLIVDVLQCIGLSIIILIILHIILKKYSYLFSIILFAIGTLCFVTEPLYRELHLNNIPLVFANYVSKENGSVFTIIPWFGFSAFGAFIATVFYRHIEKNKFKLLTIISFLTVGIFLIYYSSWLLIKLYQLTDVQLFHDSANFNYLFKRLGNVLVLFGIFYLFERYIKASIILKIGQKTLSIYIIHFVALYGSFTGLGLNSFWNKALLPKEAILGALVFIIIVCLIAFYYARSNTYIYTKIKLLFNKLKRN